MGEQPPRDRVVGQPLVGIAHSTYSEPEFIVEGIGPASFRVHYLLLGNGLVLDLFIAELTVASLPDGATPGETDGIAPGELLGRRIAAVVRDETGAVLVILDGAIFLKDANDGFYGNPLLAGRLEEHYTKAERVSFVDYWTDRPASPGLPLATPSSDFGSTPA
ncbi:MAG TPA: hypothetical protein VG406_28320 [Isosphaeraceae bacterium]|nr:hypothetical protein [Isosphaeraceae bacterium]